LREHCGDRLAIAYLVSYDSTLPATGAGLLHGS
jgi:hypothetical protein